MLKRSFNQLKLQIINKIKRFFPELILFLVNSLIFKLKKIDYWLTKNDPAPNPQSFDDLTPVIDPIKSRPYLDALAWALKNNQIKNIALTGPYGSGKSSILKTFEIENPFNHYLNISLASFFEKKFHKEKKISFEKEETKNLNNWEIKQKQNDEINQQFTKNISNEEFRLIELSILQQMFYKVSGKEIPDSRFKRIENLSVSRLFYFYVILIVALLGLYLLFSNQFIIEIAWWQNFQEQHRELVIYVGAFLIFFSGWHLSVYFFRFFNHTKFNKMNLQSGEIEFDSKGDSSILNKHFDEILYFFEVTSYNVVIIEDLDRFNKPEIFTKLREINTLINNSKQIRRHIVFIYAIKDDIFQDYNRTKFFDFIIPVLPVVTWSNSLQIFQERVIKLNLNISKKLLSSITLYIDDMRMIKNIFNEYMLYKENLKSIFVNQDKLMGMIVYKNKYPVDFANLHKNEGIVHTVFKSKSKLIKGSIDKIEKDINLLKEELDKLKAVTFENIFELRSIYLLEFFNNKLLDGIQYKYSKITIEDLKKTEKFKLLFSNEDIRINGENITNPENMFKLIEKKINPELTYLEREALIIKRETKRIEEIEKEIQLQQVKISKIRSQKIREIFKNNLDVIEFLPKELRKENLLRYLILEGYIDEDYTDLISYFYEGSLMTKDKTFLMHIKNGKVLDFDYTLNKIEGILEIISVSEFENDVTLNFDLVDFILINKESYNDQIITVCKHLSSKSNRSVSFIKEYINRGNQITLFIKTICETWDGFWISLENDFNYSRDELIHILKLIVYNVELKTIEKLNINLSLTTFISTESKFIKLFSDEEFIPKIKQVIENLQVKFEILEFYEESETLFDFIYDRNLYSINQKMIELLIITKGFQKQNIFEMLEHSNYTTILSSGCQRLIENINNQIEVYLENVFFKLPNNTKESLEAIINLFHYPSEKVSLHQKELLIKNQDIKFKSFESIIDQDLWPSILVYNKIEISWINLIDYYIYSEKSSIVDSIKDQYLIRYLNTEEVYKQLSNSKIDDVTEFDKFILDELKIAIILTNELTDISYSNLIKSISSVEDEFEFIGLSNSKINTLIQSNLITFTINNFEILRLNYYDLSVTFIENNLNPFFENLASINLNILDIEHLLKSNNLENNQKLKIINELKTEITEGNLQLSKQIVALLLRSPKVQMKHNLIKNLILVTKSIELFNMYLDDLNFDDISLLLSNFDFPFSELSKKGETLNIKHSTILYSVANKLLNKGYLKSVRRFNSILKIIT